MRRLDFFICVAALCLLRTAHAQDITVVGLKHKETLSYPVALLRGSVQGGGDSELTVTNLSSSRSSRVFRTRLFENRFKALMELVPGDNRLKLECGAKFANLTLIYVPPVTPYVVRLLYVTASDGKTEYDTQKSGDPQDYRDKLDTAAKLMQTFTAERMNDAGFGRKTFALELNSVGRVIVHTLRAPLPPSDYYKMDGNALYASIGRFVEGVLPSGQAKNIVIMGFSRFDPGEKRPLAHTALGGGGMGLFSNLSLFSWPSRLQDVPAAFSDTTPVDASKVHDDSAFRSVLWGLASTTMGAVLHETGHTFGLPHVEDPFSIMSRGFDAFHRAFTLIEPPHKQNPQPFAFPESEIARWDRASAEILSKSLWFQPDGPKKENGEAGK